MTIYDLDTLIAKEFNFDNFVAIDTINGIQVSRSNTPIRKIAYAVDATLATIHTAVAQKADVLFVHHGFFWGKVQAINHALYEKIKLLIDNDIALYACHLPLDAHLTMGNNAQLAQRLELKQVEGFGEIKGQKIGVKGTYSFPREVTQIYEMLYKNDQYGNTNIPIISPSTNPYQERQHAQDTHRAIETYTHNTTKVKKIAIISGGGTHDIKTAHQEGVDLYITGDASHTAWLEAKELEIHVFFAGHYFTEVWGVLAVGKFLKDVKNIDGAFIDNPTGL